VLLIAHQLGHTATMSLIEAAVLRLRMMMGMGQ
jgi:hypothetical protein